MATIRAQTSHIVLVLRRSWVNLVARKTIVFCRHLMVTFPISSRGR